MVFGYKAPLVPNAASTPMKPFLPFRSIIALICRFSNGCTPKILPLSHFVKQRPSHFNTPNQVRDIAAHIVANYCKRHGASPPTLDPVF